MSIRYLIVLFIAMGNLWWFHWLSQRSFANIVIFCKTSGPTDICVANDGISLVNWWH